MKGKSVVYKGCGKVPVTNKFSLGTAESRALKKQHQEYEENLGEVPPNKDENENELARRLSNFKISPNNDLTKRLQNLNVGKQQESKKRLISFTI